jgi:thioredoxin-related protein
MKKYLWSILIMILVACGQKPPLNNCTPPTNNNYKNLETYGYKPYYDIELARQRSKKTGRPILIMFTGYACVAIRGAEWEVLVDKDVRKLIDNYYILTVLYVDDKTPLNFIDSTKKTFDGKIITSMGQQNMTFQVNHFNSNSQPYYVFVDNDLKKIAEPIGYVRTTDKTQFIEQLKIGINKTVPNKL